MSHVDKFVIDNCGPNSTYNYVDDFFKKKVKVEITVRKYGDTGKEHRDQKRKEDLQAVLVNVVFSSEDI